MRGLLCGFRGTEQARDRSSELDVEQGAEKKLKSQPVLMALFRLALLLGKTISELNISGAEFLYWDAYLRIEPPQQGDNQRAAALMAQITNMSGRSLKDKKTVSPDDFLGKQSVQSADEQIAFMKSLGKPDG